MTETSPRRLLATLLLAVAVLLPAGQGVRAQGEPAAESGDQQGRRGGPGPGAQARVAAEPVPGELPAASTTTHRVGDLTFTAVAGAIRLTEERGTVLADIAQTTYRVDGADPRRRPVTFVVNGGPGASSAWLQFGALGPWRLPLDRAAVPPSTPPDLAPNPETWLPFTDLVFLDPVGTGYSRLVATGDDVRRTFFSIDGDIEMLAATIRRWVEENRREASPKFFVGESYGGFRGPLLARKLANDHGIGLKGLVLVSPVLDFRMRDGRNPIAAAATFPSMVAAARALDPALGDPGDLAAVERYATGDYLADLLRGPRDSTARNRLAAEVARLTGLDPALVARQGGRIDAGTFVSEVERRSGRIASLYDATALGLDPSPFDEGHGSDPVLDALRAPLTSAARELYAGRLNWPVRRRYEVLSNQVNRQWDWGRPLGAPQSASALAEALAADPTLTVTVVHGRADLVTPYMASRLVLDQIAVPEVGQRLRLEVYPGGHMFYFDAGARAAFRDAGRRVIEGP
ncbi:S10 family peptidase [Prosthecomicrobium sp. N25]|uniref:S10 family peptidase n=1 Tax=Prosthecomicrobium sp. N25 TaxID=3129254 RepID=UPI003077021C